MRADVQTPQIARLRREVLAQAGGEILEIGVRTGLNLGREKRNFGIIAEDRSWARSAGDSTGS